MNFIEEMNYKVCRRKTKKGYHFIVPVDGYKLHCEILEVGYLGWFIETEITFEDNANNIDREKCENAILKLLDMTCITRDRIEPTGYNKMLIACGHHQG